MTVESPDKPEKIPFMLRHTSLITGLAVGLALAASFSFMNTGRSTSADQPSAVITTQGDVPGIGDIPTLDEPNTSDVPAVPKG